MGLRYSKNKSVYFTIDDAPSKDFRKKVNYLHSKKIPAIFFCIGKNIEKRKSEVVYAIKKGFIIGNHSYRHIRFSELLLKECYKEIDKTDKLIEELYKRARIKRPMKIFRFPYGNKGSKSLTYVRRNKILRNIFKNLSTRKERKIQSYLKVQHYKQPKFEGITYDYFYKLNLDKDVDVFWTHDFREYDLPLKETIENSKTIFKSNSNDIILLHDHDRTLKEFFKIIEFLLSKNVKFLKCR